MKGHKDDAVHKEKMKDKHDAGTEKMDVDNDDATATATATDIATATSTAAARGSGNGTVPPYDLDCYPYSFTPLLLFAQQGNYFDKGFSNYNSVASFFHTTIQQALSSTRKVPKEDHREGDDKGNDEVAEQDNDVEDTANPNPNPNPNPNHNNVDMLENVLYDRKNMLYEELLEYIIQREMIVICCIEEHFTAFKVMPSSVSSTKSSEAASNKESTTPTRSGGGIFGIGRSKKKESRSYFESDYGATAQQPQQQQTKKSNKKAQPPSMVYYDPLNSQLQVYRGDAFYSMAIFLLLKCNYGDSNHIQENKNHYTTNAGAAVSPSSPFGGSTSTTSSSSIRHRIYYTWKRIHQLSSPPPPPLGSAGGSYKGPAYLDLTEYLLFNDRANPSLMSTQLTDNTCFFQVYWFAVLCKVGQLSCKDPTTTSTSHPSHHNSSFNTNMLLHVQNPQALQLVTVQICRFLMGFFVEHQPATHSTTSTATFATAHSGTPNTNNTRRRVLRPLTNCNVILDFYRYRTSPYFSVIVEYLRLQKPKQLLPPRLPLPQAQAQHHQQDAPMHDAEKETEDAVMMDDNDEEKNAKDHDIDDYSYVRQYHDILDYLTSQICLHPYRQFTLEGEMPSTPNTKSLQYLTSYIADVDHSNSNSSSNGGGGGTGSGTVQQLARAANYYKYRAGNFMFGFNSLIVGDLSGFSEFHTWRKNQLLHFLSYNESDHNNNNNKKDQGKEAKEAQQKQKKDYEIVRNTLAGCAAAVAASSGMTKYRDYYFMPQLEVGQLELVNVHYYTFLVDVYALSDSSILVEHDLAARIHAINDVLIDHVHFSTQKTHNYEKFQELTKNKAARTVFRNSFLSANYLQRYVGLGFGEVNPKEKTINSLTQTAFYETELMSMQANRQSFEFEKECINQMARSTIRSYRRRLDGDMNGKQKYKMIIPIGQGFTYSKYNTLMHFLNTVECYWHNPDLGNIQVFGKDIRALLAMSCQKIFFDPSHTSGYYHYGPMETNASYNRKEMDLTVGSFNETVLPSVCQAKSPRGGGNSAYNRLIITDRVFEYHYLRNILEGIFRRADGVCLKTDNEILNLCLLSLMLDFGLYHEHFALLNLPMLQCLHHLKHDEHTAPPIAPDTKELQVEIANLIYEFDRNNSTDSVRRSKVEELLFEASNKFLINKDLSVNSSQFKLIRMLNADPDYQRYILLCKSYVSLCQINKSTEVDYYKVRCDDEFRIIIPQNYSKATGDYLENITGRYTFSERDNFIVYDDLPIFDMQPQQPAINLYKVRFDSATEVQSMVKYIEIKNVLKIEGWDEQYLVFVADNVLLLDVSKGDGMSITINQIAVEVATMFFNVAISFVPCFKYAESSDVVFFTSQNFHYMVDKGGQFHSEYYGMKHELIQCINSEEVYVDLNDEHVFKSFKLSELLTESKVVVYAPDFLLQVTDRIQLISLLDLAIHLRNVSFFILVMFYLRRSSVRLEYVAKEGDVVKISGPWKKAILYVLGQASNPHYDDIFQNQFFNLNQHKDAPLDDFIDILCENFTKYQRFIDGEYQIVPRPKQKAFLKRILCSEECFHFSEVGSGKTKVILPLLCQLFLSNNAEAHTHLARGGKMKDVLVILVPEHLVSDARTQVFRYCLNLNFRNDYRVYDDIFALMHRNVKLGQMKKIFVTSFNQFKKALTYDLICHKVQPHREHFLVVADEVDDFLDRNKLVFNICSNMNNSFDRPTLDLFYETSRAAYCGNDSISASLLESSSNPNYWNHLVKKFIAIHEEIQDASKSINKSFGIFNEYTLRHCSTNITHDIEGYKSLIARPYESVNRAMPGSYYSDVERTIYLTYVILTQDIAKYNELFQSERKFISFEYWNAHFVHQIEFDDLVYGHEKLAEIVNKHPEASDGLTRFLYEIILRRMEIRSKSRSVNSIDVIFNFDCVGFTGTPFLDNYPTFQYIRDEREDSIPHMIDRSFYAYTSEGLSVDTFEERFGRFQGQNSNVIADYVSSDFIKDSTDEMATLEWIFAYEENARILAGVTGTNDGNSAVDFNVLVDLCGIFKRSSIHDIAHLIKKHFGPDRFLYVYHIDTNDNSDRILCLKSDNDVQYDEEFYKYLCKTYDAGLRDKVFFFVDNRNVIGKDIPFQLVYQRRYGKPLFKKSVVLAHDVDSFSAIWQAMGRSRTMNQTVFSIYKSGIADEIAKEDLGAVDIKKHELTRRLYVGNCDRIMAGNISSIYLTLIALYNLSKGSFYYSDEIVNVFLEKMEQTIAGKLSLHEEKLVRSVLGSRAPALILRHILKDKFQRSSNELVSSEVLEEESVTSLLRHIVQQKYEQRVPSRDRFDDFVVFLSGEQHSQMEISYTKQQQKQKTKQQNKNQDSDAMGVFDKNNQLTLWEETKDYFKLTLTPQNDFPKLSLNLVSPVPIASVAYNFEGSRRSIMVYPTLQFIYSHHIYGEYISQEVQEAIKSFDGNYSNYFQRFLEAVEKNKDGTPPENDMDAEPVDPTIRPLGITVISNLVRQSPLFSIAALEQGVYIIGMKDQFNVHDFVQSHPLQQRIQYIADDTGFILFDKTNEKHVDRFGPYFIEQYILLEMLTKHEVAQNVMDYYCNHKGTLQHGLDTYDEKQGKGFICWRFLMNEAVKMASLSSNGSSKGPSIAGIKRPRPDKDGKDADAVAAGFSRALDL